jgi:acyl carrier protein
VNDRKLGSLGHGSRSATDMTHKETHIMAMTEREILAGLGEIIDEIAGVPADEVTPDKSFVDDLDIDSLSMVEIAVASQDKFGVEIPDDELKNLRTVKDVIDYVQRAAVSA